jgi:hypothetical protein
LISTSLFQNGMATFDDVLNAVNFRVEENGGSHFSETHGREALTLMSDKNELMWLEDEDQVYTL